MKEGSLEVFDTKLREIALSKEYLMEKKSLILSLLVHSTENLPLEVVISRIELLESKLQQFNAELIALDEKEEGINIEK